MKFWTRVMLAAYFGTLAWQVAWHGLLPPPMGSANAWLSGAACAPLLIPAIGLLRRTRHSLAWAGLVLVFYLAIGAMEAWSNPPQRLPALVQVTLFVLYLLAFRMRQRAVTSPAARP